MLPNSTYGPSFPSPPPLMLASEALATFLRSLGSAMRPVGVDVTQPGGRLDGVVSWANVTAPGAASITTRPRERNAFLPSLRRSRMIITVDSPHGGSRCTAREEGRGKFAATGARARETRKSAAIAGG